MEEYIKKKNIYMSNSNKIINELYNNLIYDEYSENILSKKGVKEKDHIEYYEEQNIHMKANEESTNISIDIPPCCQIIYDNVDDATNEQYDNSQKDTYNWYMQKTNNNKLLYHINKNLIFLKRIQQYFYQKYINIKFSNDTNDYYYIIHLEWFNKLKKFINNESNDFPGSISNWELYEYTHDEIFKNYNISESNYVFSDDKNMNDNIYLKKQCLKKNLKEGKDYICTNKYMWRFLQFFI